MARRHAPGRIVRSTRRETVWLQFAQTRTAVDVSTAVLVFTLNAAALALRPFTIIRTRFELLMSSDQIAATENQNAAFGAAIVSDQAAAIGVTAVPTPVTDLGSDLWFVIQQMNQRIVFGDATGFDSRAGERYEVDSKAMRRCDVGQDMAVVLEASSISAGTTIVIGGRMLAKLH